MKPLLFLVVLLSHAKIFAGNLQCVHVPQLFEIYLKNHYQEKQLNDVIKEKTMDQFIKILDPSKTSFLEEDVTLIRDHLRGLWKSMGSGQCNAMDMIMATVMKRAVENEGIVKDLLASKNFKLDETAELIVDPKKRKFSVTLAEKQENLKRMAHFQFSNYLLSDLKLPEAKKQLTHSYELVIKRLTEKKQSDYLENFVEAFAGALDPHSSFLTSDDLENFQIHMQLSLEGIGATLTSQNGFTVVESLVAGGSAERSKVIEPKDKIIAVKQENGKPVSTIDMDLRDVVKMIRGKKGTRVILTILRQSEETKTFDATIVRDKIDIKDQAAKIVYQEIKDKDKTYHLGILDLPSFYGGTGRTARSSSADVRALLEEAREKKVDGIVLDLSKNGGGLLEEAVKITGLFLKTAAVVSTKDSRGRKQVLMDDDDRTIYSGPLVVLISRYSASASEILAGALKNYKRAVILGSDHTFGKGSVQALSDLPLDMGAMKVTTGLYFLPNGESTQLNGVTAHIVVPSLSSQDDIGEGTQDNALPAQKIDGFLSAEANAPGEFQWKPLDDEVIQKLITQSKVRVEKDPKFAEIRTSLKEIEENKNVIRLSNIRKKSREEKKKEKGSKNKKPNDTKEWLESPHVQEAMRVTTDLIVQLPSAKASSLVGHNPASEPPTGSTSETPVVQ